ncbi:MAG: diguanylate cyclase, partial [Deltaproteobacteria bacterium]|nr:diguanylate cyclase [Deltaproteobacteria bacterium]
IDGIAQTLDIIDEEDRIALVLEDFGGVSLKEVLQEGNLSIERFLDLAIRLSEILGNIHRHNITHRDIKPLNILLNRETGMIKITDFGIATEIKEMYDPGVMEGTLAYISPEQTGRMNRPVDYRTDLYSLGITFYEMLTGQVPFMSKDPLEIIHSHIARAPVPPDRLNAQIPPPLSDMVMRLLSKAVEDRYQNAFGLMADLTACLDQLRTTGRTEPFELGRLDHSLRFIIPQMVVGRDHELQILFEAFDWVNHGGAGIILVAGEPGIGKSTLVNEIQKPIVEARGYFISGKYEQFRRHVPYSAIVQAFQAFTRRLMTESEERIRLWKEKLLWALDSNGKVITNAVPEMELIIGQQPDIPELGPEENQNRFNMVFKNFLRVFAEREHPLVFFLDDLQWADTASLKLIQSIATDQDTRFILLIGAYRDNETAAHHPLMLTVDAIRKTGLTINTITLGAINPNDVNRIVSSLLQCTPDLSFSLAQIVYEKTKGNPFFVNRFLETLYREGLIAADTAGGWIWDLKKIEEMEVTDNVAQFMADKMKDLPPDSLHIIEICACIGNRFDLQTLSSIAPHPLDKILSLIDTLIEEGLIHPKGNLYQLRHDRIREAAYSLLTPEEREQIHFQIGNLELKRSTPADLSHRIIYIVDQLNLGHRLIPVQAERNRLADLNLKAGVKAKESSAYGAALNYLTTGINLLPEGAWQTEYSLTYALHSELMECRYLNRDFPEAERLFEVIIANAQTRLDKARAHNTMVIMYTNMSQPQKAIQMGLTALGYFGMRIPADISRSRVLRELAKVRRRIGEITLEKIIDLPRMDDPELSVIHDLMLNIGTPAYYVNTNLSSLVNLKKANSILRHGHTPHSAVTFMSVATTVQNFQEDYTLAYRLGEMALKLNERLDNRKIAGRIYHLFAFFIQHWRKHIRHDLESYAKCYELSLNSGDFIYGGHSITAAADIRLRISPTLDEVQDELEKYRDFMNLLNDPLITNQFLQFSQYIDILKGVPSGKSVPAGNGSVFFAFIDRMKKEGNFFGLCFALSPVILTFMRAGKYEVALLMAAELDTYIHATLGTVLDADFHFNYSLILTALLKQGETERKKEFKALIRRNQRKMAKWAGLCPENFQHKFDLVEAETAGIEGRLWEALGLYHKAIDGARRNKYIQEEALACERAGIFFRDAGLEEEARTFITRAYQCYVHWGSKTQMKIMEDRYPSFISKESETRQTDFFATATSTGTASTMMDIATVMQTSQAISSEIVLERLLQKIMNLAIVNAGAQRGFLIIDTDGKLTIEAAKDVEDKDIQVLRSIALDTSDDLSKAVVNYVLRSGENVILGNAAHEGAFKNDPYVKRNRCKSILCTPIMYQGRITGILYMENNLTAHAFTPERLELLGIISAQAAISLENAKLFDLATTDGLTKLYGHRYFQLLLDKEIQRYQRYKTAFALIMMDIDDFKKVNDTYGHPVGDDVLRNVAKTLKKISRVVDIPARYGGEEFVLILPNTDLPGAMVAAEKIRKAMEGMEIPHDADMIRVTISLGAAVFPDHASEKDGLIKSADEALYASKRKGKNCVSLGKKPDNA